MATPNQAALNQAAAKSAITSAAVNAAVIAAASQSSQTSPANQTQNQGSSGSKQNPPRGFEGPSTGQPTVSRPSIDSLAPKTAADKQAIGVMAGVGTASTAFSSAKDKFTDLAESTSKTDTPGFDQGFGSKPVTLGAKPLAGNPMAPFLNSSTNVPVLGNDTDKPPISSGAAGSGMVSDNPNEDKKENVKESYPGATSAANATTTKDGDVEEKTPTKQASADKEWKDKLFLEKLADIMTGMRNLDGTLTEKAKRLEEANKDNAGMPVPDGISEHGTYNPILTQTTRDQLKAGKPASQGGSSDVNPVREGGMDAVVKNGSIAVNESSLQQKKLFGQPLPPGMGESGGGTSATPYTGSNSAGVINPGDEAGIPGGDPRFQQDPGAALGGRKPTLAPPELNGTANSNQTSASEQSSDITATLAAGIRNLTLTGSTAINGTGNTLDNRIIGNQAANELWGGAGDDNLDGQAGNDLLDGGDGRDVLTGGLGADRFRFATPGAFGTVQADRITDFSRSEGDRIELSRSAFGLSAGATLSFQTVNNDADLTRALGSSTLLIQDLRNGSILFNQNGTAAGAGQGGVFAVVNQGLTLQGSDFAFVA